jgi:GT2 family glycosyltransferase
MLKYFMQMIVRFFMNDLDWYPLVSIIILNWNRKDDVEETLNKIKQQSYNNVEIIVVDNGSNDNSVDIIERNFPLITVIALPCNIGCEDGNNVGILNAKGEIILFLDSDAGIEKDGISKLIESFYEDKAVGIVEPRIIRPADNYIINEPKYWGNKFTGCVVAFRASVFKDIGLRPGEYFIYASEPDISLRAIELGYKIVHRSDVIGEHRESPTARLSKKFYYYSTRNCLWLIWRYYPLQSAVYETIFLLTFYLVLSIKTFAFRYYIQGVFAGIIGFKSQVIGKRKVLKRYNEARLFPGYKDLIKILKLKIFKFTNGDSS